MVILVDTNILVDVIVDRQPYAEYAKKILEKCAKREVTGILAAHSIPNLFYILRKEFTNAERRALLKGICNIFRISDLNAKKILSALDNDPFVDFEDCLQEECAVEEAADFIVTRNPGDFSSARVNVIPPDVFLSRYQS